MTIDIHDRAFDESELGDIALELVAASIRRNKGRPLLTREAALDLAKAFRTAEEACFEDMHGDERIIDARLCVTFAAQRWFVDGPGFMVGDRVFCVPSRQGDALQVRAHRESTLGIWAVPEALAHSPRRNAQPECSGPNSGSQTTSHERQGSDQTRDPSAPPPIPGPSSSSRQGRKRNRKRGTKPAASAPRQGAIHVVLHVKFEQLPRTQGIDKPLRS